MDKRKIMIEDLKNFNPLITQLKTLKIELNLYIDKEEAFKSEVEYLIKDIKKHENMIDKIKISLTILSPEEFNIITRYYVEKHTLRDIACSIGYSEGGMLRKKNKIINKLADVMYSDNSLDYIDIVRVVPYKKNCNTIFQYDLQGNFLRKWNSAKQCESECGLHVAGIRDCCSGRYKTYRGYKWSYMPLQISKSI